MNYNPIYPVFVRYNVSQEIWNMHDIYVWHFLLKSFGTKKTFRYLQYRLEHNQSMYPVFKFLAVVFLISQLITFWFKFNHFRRQFRNQNLITALERFFLNFTPNNLVIERRAPLIRRDQIENRIPIRNQPNTESTGNSNLTTESNRTINQTNNTSVSNQ